MSIATSNIVEGNIYQIVVHFSNSPDTFIYLIIDGEKKNYSDIINDLYPKTIMHCSIAQKKKFAAYNDGAIEFEYINFIYKKKIFNKHYIKHFLNLCYEHQRYYIDNRC